MSDRKFNDLPNHPRFRERTDLDGMGFILVPEPTHCPKCVFRSIVNTDSAGT